MPSAASFPLILFTLVSALYTPIYAAQGTAENKTVASASPWPSISTGIQRKQCAHIRQRREWRTLSNTEKASYIRAIKCLQTLPAEKPVIPQAKSRYDEFQAYHIKQADSVHVTGEFLPWHRQYVKIYEDELRNKCGYKGVNPYWDWSQDTDSSQTLAAATVFDPETGFGGNGVPRTYSLPTRTPPADYCINVTSYRGCAMDGPFSNHTIPIGPGKYVGGHCLTRGIHEDVKIYLNSGAVANVIKLPTYELFRIELEGLPLTDGHRLHDGGHYAVGGEMSNFYSSPGYPLFYLHHANLDRIWWHWQTMVPSRLYEISGRSTTKPPYHNGTLDYPIKMGNLGPSVVIRDVMDIHSKPNCYTYV